MWGVGKAEALRREGASIYVGDHVHDVEGARAAGALSVSVLTGGCTREELLAAGTDVVLDDLDDVPGLARRAPPRPPGSRRSRPTCGARGSLLVAYSGGADSAFLLAAAVRALGPDRVGGRHRLLRLAAAGRARPGPGLRRRARASRLLTPAHPRDGARGLPRQRAATGASSARPS